MLDENILEQIKKLSLAFTSESRSPPARYAISDDHNFSTLKHLPSPVSFASLYIISAHNDTVLKNRVLKYQK